MITNFNWMKYAYSVALFINRILSRLASISIKQTWRDTRAKYRKGWSPFSLRWPVLTIFLGTLLCLLVTLSVLYSYANNNERAGSAPAVFNQIGGQGLLLLTTNHYTWTYGPTAVFTLVIGFWRLVDFHCKALLPWSKLEGNPIQAEKGILLDYISPFLVISLAKACLNRHFIVALTTCGFIILKLTTVFSTGLLFPSSTIIYGLNTEAIQTSMFDNLTHFDPTVDPGPAPFYNAYASQYGGNALQTMDTSNNVVFEDLAPLNDHGASNVSFQSISRAFWPGVECFPVQAEVLSDITLLGNGTPAYLPLQIQTDESWTCPPAIGNQSDGIGVFVLDVTKRVCPPRQLIPSFGIAPCNRTKPATQDAYPILIALSDVRYSQTFNSSPPSAQVGQLLQPETSSLDIPSVTAVLCQISYNMFSLPVAVNATPSGIVNVPSSEYDLGYDTLPNLSNSWLTSQLSYADPAVEGGAKDMFGKFEDQAFSEQPPRTMMKLVTASYNGDYAFILNESYQLGDLAESVMTTILSELVSQTFLRQVNDTFKAPPFQAQLLIYEQRLQVQPTSFKVMIAGISVMIAFTVAVLICRPAITSAKNPETILNSWKILANSHEFSDHMFCVAGSDKSPSVQYLKQFRYHTHDDDGRVILSVSSNPGSLNCVRPEVNQTEWYYTPLTLKRPVIVMTLLASPLLIVTLALLQYRSDKSQGLLSLGNAGSFETSFFTRLLPASIALSIATLYNSLDFNATILAPYSKMRWTGISYGALRRQILGRLTPVALYIAVRNAYWGAVLTGVAAFTGSLLTIVASGLYTVENGLQVTTPITMSTLDLFDFSYQQTSYGDNGTSILLSLIESSSLPWPAFTNDTLVLQTPSMPQLTYANWNKTGSITAPAPAWRANLSCTELSPELLNVTVQSSQVSVHGHIPMPANCLNNNETYLEFQSEPRNSGSTTDSNYVAEYVDLYFDNSTDGQLESNQSCPSVVLYYGMLDRQGQDQSKLTAYTCWQNIQQFSTQTIYSFDYDVSFNLTISHVALPDTSEPMPWKIKETDIDESTNFWWRVQKNLDTGFMVFNPNNTGLYDSEGNYDPSKRSSVSNFFQGVLFGSTPLSIDKLAATDQDSKAEVFDHIQAFYRRYMAQYISTSMRVPADGTIDMVWGNQSTSNASSDRGVTVLPSHLLTNAGLPRLVQHRLPTSILQGMLAVMFICSALACYMGTFHDVVKWNPCTIAGVMSVAAGSRMCDPDFVHDSAGTKAVKPTADEPEDDKSVRSSGSTTCVSAFETEIDDLFSHTQLQLSLSIASCQSEKTKSQDSLLGENSLALHEMKLGRAEHWLWNDTLTQCTARFRLGWWNSEGYIHSSRRFRLGSSSTALLSSVKDNRGRSVEDVQNLDGTVYRGRRYGVDVIL